MNQLKPTLTLTQGLGLLTSALLGTGVFIVPELTVKTSGHNALWGWLVLILAILPVAFAFGQLGRQFPHAGGASHFVEIAFGRTQGRIIGWLFIALLPVGLPAAMAMAVWFLHSLIPLSEEAQLGVKVALLVAMMLVNLRGIQVSGVMQTVIAATVSAVVILLTVLALTGAEPAAAITVSTLDSGLIGATAALAFWSFIGVEALAHVSSEFKNPQRDFPLALILGVLLVGLVYSLGTWLVLAFPSSQTPEIPAMVVLFDQMVGNWGGLCIGLFGFLSCVATMNIYHASSSRMLWSLAQAGDAPALLGRVNRQHAPATAVIAMTGICLLSILITDALQMTLEGLILLANGIVVLIYLLTMMAAIKLLKRWQKLLPALGMAMCLWLAVSLAASMLYAAVLYVAVWSWFRVTGLGPSGALEKAT